eukprot:UN29973
MFLEVGFCLTRLPEVLRIIVRTNKQGIRYGRFTLDLCYITPEILAMGLPATGLECCYRNNIIDVANYLDGKHTGKYRLIDLCEERSYNQTIFHNQVYRAPFPDHSVPALGTLAYVCLVSLKFLENDRKNVIVVHCKGGKVRTGVICVGIASFLYIKNSVEELLDHFSKMRTNETIPGDVQRIVNPCQIRYCHYVHSL